MCSAYSCASVLQRSRGVPHRPAPSRCGVFSKTDIQNLIARNATKEDIAASIFRAVAVQTASALSHGCEIRSKVLFCGGPLTFISSLRKAIANYFELDLEKDFVILENANTIPAYGTALTTDEAVPMTIDELNEKLSSEPHEPQQKKKNSNLVW